MDKFISLLRKKYKLVAIALSGISLLVGGLCVSLFELDSMSCMVTVWIMGAISVMVAVALNIKPDDRVCDNVVLDHSVFELLSACKYAHNIMDKTGWRLSDYINRWRDCEDYAERQSTLMKEWFYLNCKPSSGSGIGVAPFGYTRKDGRGHVCVEGRINSDRSLYFEVYPGYDSPITLTEKELSTAKWNNFRN